MKKIIFGFLAILLSILAILGLFNSAKFVKASDELDFDVPEFCLIDANTGKVVGGAGGAP